MRPSSWFRVVSASTRLSWSVKAVWDAIRTLDSKGAGCWMTARTMAPRLALSPDTIDAARTQLRRAGLLEADGKPPRVVYWVQLPAACQPSGTSPKDEEVLRLAALLDQRIAEIESADQVQRAVDRVSRIQVRHDQQAMPYRGTALDPVSSPASAPKGGRGVLSPHSFEPIGRSSLLTSFQSARSRSVDLNHNEPGNQDPNRGESR